MFPGRGFLTRFALLPLLALSFAGTQVAAQDALQHHVHYTGEIFLTTASACPVGTLDADGRELPINNYASLYALMIGQFGTGEHMKVFSFHLPDLRNTAVLKGSRYCIVVRGVYPR